MNKNEIYIKSGTDYKEMTKELLAPVSYTHLLCTEECIYFL